MNHGKIEQRGTPDEVFEHPATPFVMDFLGNVNVFHGRVEKGQAFWHGIPIDYPDYPHAQASPARVYLRPHELDIARADPSKPGGHRPNDEAVAGRLPASVLRIARSGAIARVSCLPDGSDTELHVDLPVETARELSLQPGERVTITPRKVRVLLPDPEYVI